MQQTAVVHNFNRGKKNRVNAAISDNSTNSLEKICQSFPVSFDGVVHVAI